jgi:hypothetical protein
MLAWNRSAALLSIAVEISSKLPDENSPGLHVDLNLDGPPSPPFDVHLFTFNQPSS